MCQDLISTRSRHAGPQNGATTASQGHPVVDSLYTLDYLTLRKTSTTSKFWLRYIPYSPPLPKPHQGSTSIQVASLRGFGVSRVQRLEVVLFTARHCRSLTSDHIRILAPEEGLALLEHLTCANIDGPRRWYWQLVDTL